MTTEDVIAHHGILGMKWGIRRFQNPDGSLTAAGKKRYSKGNVLEGQKLKYDSMFRQELRNDIKLIPHQMLAYLVPGYGLAFNAISIKKSMDYNSTKEYKQKHASLKELNKKETVLSDISKDVKEVNKTGKKGYVKNCFNCVCALEMRQRGYDVVASPRSVGTYSTEYLKHFNGVEIGSHSTNRNDKESRKKWVERSYSELCSQLEANGPNARGFLSFTYENSNSGHTITWFTNSSGEVYFYDPQSGSTNATNTLSLSSQNYTYGRLDNAKVKDSITEVVTNRKEKRK